MAGDKGLNDDKGIKNVLGGFTDEGRKDERERK